MLKILVFLLLTSIVYSQDNPCIGGEKCTCTCTQIKNRYYKELLKQGHKFPKMICGCPEGGCGGCGKEEVPEFKFKKTNNSAVARMLP